MILQRFFPDGSIVVKSLKGFFLDNAQMSLEGSIVVNTSKGSFRDRQCLNEP